MGATTARVTLLRIVVVALAYAATAGVGLHFATLAGAVTLVWAPAGIGLAAALRWGPGMALAVGLGNFAVGMAVGHPVAFSAWAGAGAAGEALLGAWLATRVGRFRGDFESTRDVLAFVFLGAVLGSAPAGAWGACGLAMFGLVPWDVVGAAATRWWVADGVGVLVVAPSLLTWSRGWSSIATRARAAEAALLALTLTGGSLAVFHTHLLSTPAYPLAFTLLPGLAWAAYRFRPFGAALASLYVALFAVSGTLLGEGPFIAGDREASLGLTLGYVGTISCGSLVIAALVASRERAERALHENQSWLGLVERSAGLGTWLWDPATGVLRGSDQAHRLYGVEPGETRIGRDDVLGYMAPEDVDRVFRAARTAYRNRGSLDVEYRVVWPDGSLHWLASVGRCIPIRPDDPDGPVQMVGVHLDIDDRKQFHDALRRSERLASLGTFAAGMAHEINNPVGTILLAARSAQQAVDDHESVRSALQDIVEDAQRTAQIVKNVLRFAQSRAHEQGDLDLNACIRRARVLTRGYASQRGVALELDLDEGPLVVTGNATELEQVFVNLIRNAVESSPKGASISIETRVLGDQVRASVTDRGRGISDSALPRIFDPFFTTRSPEGGIGLGLSICHGIVAAAGGTLEVESQLHSGTTFRVNLPRSRAGAGAVHS